MTSSTPVRSDHAVGPNRGPLAVVLAAVLVAFASAVHARHHLLDDALIHLRFAENLIELGELAFNPGERSFGSSSVGWLMLVSAWQYVLPGPSGLKALALGFYAGVIALAALDALRLGRPRHWLALLAVCSPMGTRWLTDGMETCASLLAVYLTSRAMSAERPWVAVLGAATMSVLLRVELALFVAGLAAMSMLRGQRVRALAALGGIPVAASITWLFADALLSDAAVAKSQGMGAVPLSNMLQSIATSHAASYAFGAALLLAWGAALMECLVRGERLQTLVAMSPWLALVSAAAVRSQEIHGVRYFAWALLAGVVLANERVANGTPAAGWRLRGLPLAGVAGLVAVAWLYEWPIVGRIVEGRGVSLNRIQAAGLDRLRGTQGVAWDVGFIGYFSKGAVCDPHGLVNGRAVAMLPKPARLSRCIELPLEWAFVNRGQYDVLVSRLPSLISWQTCPGLALEFPNVRSADEHVLLFPEARAKQWCDAPVRPFGVN